MWDDGHETSDIRGRIGVKGRVFFSVVYQIGVNDPDLSRGTASLSDLLPVSLRTALDSIPSLTPLFPFPLTSLSSRVSSCFRTSVIPHGERPSEGPQSLKVLQAG